MGRTKRAGRSGRGRGRGGEPNIGDRSDNGYRTNTVTREDMHNERFERYYKTQKIVSEEEWETFMESMRSPLPTTFRVAGSRQTAQLLNDMIKETHVPHLAQVIFEGESVSPPAQIPWYPDGLAWQFDVSKKVLRKSPEFKRFHSFLVFETEVGNISRQEAVSMLPPLYLEVEPHHRVMDMCAAPGSKTAQLLEALHANDTVTSSSFPTGLLIANDSDHKRTHLLIHQSARLPSPALMVTNHDASIYPAIKIPSEQTIFPSGTKARVVSKKQYQLLFDRILCDVPCSGDGTLRKNPGIWNHWSPMDGNGLHSLQIRILQRAMRMLKKGGRIVYSTCSLNPVENEAVVAAALQSIPGFELIDISNHLPGLIHRSGMATWTPTVDRNVVTDFKTYDEYIQSLPEDKRDESKMLKSHWPPPVNEGNSLNLTRCLRVYPHLQNTGGFFIAVIQKVPSQPAVGDAAWKDPTEGKRQADAVDGLETSEVKKPKLDEAAQQAEDEDENLVDEASETSTGVDIESQVPSAHNSDKRKPHPGGTNKGKAKPTEGSGTHFKENPYTFVSPDDPITKSCIAKLRLKPDFPATNILVRNPEGEPMRSLYMTNDIVKHIVQSNDYTRMRLMTCGTKVFAKQEGAEAKREGAEMQFRVLSEGLPVVLPYIEPEAILQADVATLKVFMESYYPLCASFTDPFKFLVQSKETGSYIVRFQPGQVGNASLTHDLALPIWKSKTSVTLMIDKKAKSALSLRVFGEDITTVARVASQKREQEKAASAVDVSVVADEEQDVVEEMVDNVDTSDAVATE